MARLVLASTSVYRRELLQRLRVPFEVASPEVDETAHAGELPPHTAERLAAAKARAVAARFPDALIIGSDQVAYCGTAIYSKPRTRERAIAQLHALSGQRVCFHTAVCLFNAASGREQLRAVPTEVKFRTLTRGEIERYVDLDQPLDCAGSAKSEGLGIALLEYLRGDDPNALVGLPLIALCDMLRAEAVGLP